MPLAVLLILSAIALLAVLALGGCGSSTEGGDTGGGTATETTIEVGGPDTEVASIPITSDPALYEMLPDSIKSSGKIRVSMQIPYAPWQYYFSAGSDVPVGIEPDLLKALAAKFGGIEIVITQTPFDGIIPGILANKADLGVSCFYDTAERQKAVDFVDYAQDGTGMIVLKGNPEGITDLDSLSGKVVSVQKATTQYDFLIKTNEEFAAAGKPEIEILALPDDSAAQLAVKSGKAVADMTDGPGGAYVAKTSGGGTVFEAIIDPAFPGGYDPATIGILMKKGVLDMPEAFQGAFQQLLDEGVTLQILDLYGAGQCLLDPITINLGT